MEDNNTTRKTLYFQAIRWAVYWKCLSITPVPQRFWLILHSSEARFISSGHLRKTIVSQSDESDLCLLTIRSVSDVFGAV